MNTRTTALTRRTAGVVGAVALAALAVAAPSAQAAPRTGTVDPSTLQPALNPDFAPWTCWEAGAGITCQGSYQASYDETFGSCDGRELRISGSIEERMTRWHTSDGLATRTSVHLDAPGDVFSLAGTDETVTLRGHWNRHYTYPVPGDRDSRVMSEVGAIYVLTVPGSGIVVQDAGRITFAPGGEFEQIASSGGPHDVYDDWTIVERVICDALT